MKLNYRQLRCYLSNCCPDFLDDLNHPSIYAHIEVNHSEYFIFSYDKMEEKIFTLIYNKDNSFGFTVKFKIIDIKIFQNKDIKFIISDFLGENINEIFRDIYYMTI